ncbi:MAG TPA: putative Ig domain-containing protein [Conexibacter sp.]|nr:putative Ig domain-containing protein [Conexibacter sp.]
MRHLFVAFLLIGVITPPALAVEPSVVPASSSPALIAGAAAGDRLASPQKVGDVDGDGIEDLLLFQDGFYGEFSSYEQETAYVVFGRGNDEPVDLATLGARGFTIAMPQEWGSGASVSAAGDVNGDGRGDLAFSYDGGSPLGRRSAGRVFVVFGKSGSAPVDLTAFGSGGYEVYGSARSVMAEAVGPVEDVNGDGLDELLVAEAYYPWRVSVVFGKATTAPVDLAALGAGGYRIGGVDYVWSPTSVGDVNGDGRGDVAVVGDCEWNRRPCSDRHMSIVFGKPSTAEVDLAQLGVGGFQIHYLQNASPSRVGDVNGDGRDDIGVTNSYTDPRGNYSHAAYVIFGPAGTTSPVDLHGLGDGGFSIRDAYPPFDGVGDVDGDGRDDVAARLVLSATESVTGVVFGKSDSAPVDRRQLLDRAFLLGSPTADSAVGTTSFGAGPRIALNYRVDAPFDRREAGSVRFVAPPPPHFELPTARAYVAGSAIDPIAAVAVRRSSPLTFTVSPALPAGLRLDAAGGTISGTPTQPTPATIYTVTAIDRLGASSRAITLRIDRDAYATTLPADGAVVGEWPTLVWERASTPDDSEPVGAYAVMLDGAALATVPADACGPTSCSLAVPARLADGPHRWHVETTARDGRLRRTPTATMTVVAPPTARLTLSAAAVHTGAPLQLDASGSTDVNGAIARYAFDLDGDGSFESDGAASQRTATFATVGDRRLGVRVTDAGGSTSEAFADVHVAPAPPAGEPGVSINAGAIATNDPNVRLSIVWPALADTALVSNDGGFGAVGATTSIPLAASVPWRLAVAGSERLPRIVYLRMRGGTAGRETYTDDIILDQRPPQIVGTRLVTAAPRVRNGRARGSASAKRRGTATLTVTGRDDNSGVSRIEVAARRGGRAIATKQLATGNRRGRRTTKVAFRIRPAVRVAWVRVTDVAGNRSAWKAGRGRR